ncbi:MAG TPA: PDZ domain-containing protein, partial [Kofleriaceae bacterium]|nr:PDZ domain-containing protein [Kofleriaceae bacterium]
MRAALLVAVAACTPAASKVAAPPAQPAPAAAPAPDDGQPKWIGVVFDAGTARVGQVIPGSPAYDAGIRRDDVVITFDGHPITIGKEVPPLVQQHAAGSTATIVIKRGTAEQTLQLRIQPR